MGHDISGYLRADTGHSEEIAYLRRGAFNPLKGTIYEALQCEELNCGCSGCGNEQEFTQEQLTEALARVPEGEDYEPEREFLCKCLAVRGGVRIAFY
jgi:hypothetical protein